MESQYMETTYNPEMEECTRKEQERRVVYEGTAMWRRRKEELQCQKHREQRELRQMQTNYSPWGKPGGGAKYEGSLRKKNVRLEPLNPPKTAHCSESTAYFPWGRPGPGGVPWRDPRLLGVRFLESMGWTTGSFIARREKEKKNSLTFANGNEFYDARAKSGSISRAHQFDEALQSQDNQNPYKEEVQVYELTGGVELVPLLTSRRHYSNPTYCRYSITDATRPGYTIDNLRSLNIGNQEHITELTKQIQRKRERALKERRVEQESCRRHFDTWSKLWGRPGHGAPIIDHLYRNDLHDILYRSVIY